MFSGATVTVSFHERRRFSFSDLLLPETRFNVVANEGEGIVILAQRMIDEQPKGRDNGKGAAHRNEVELVS